MTQSGDTWDTWKNITKNDLHLKIKLLENITCPAYSQPSSDLKDLKDMIFPSMCSPFPFAVVVSNLTNMPSFLICKNK